MSDSRKRRLEKRQQAAVALEKHSGVVMGMLGQVINELGDEVDGLNQFQQDAQYAAELAYRIDKGLTLGDPILEALDGVIAFFVALGAIGIWRAIARQDKIRSKRISNLSERLKKNGDKMAKFHRINLERRLKRLQAKMES